MQAQAEWAETIKEIVSVPLIEKSPPVDLEAAIQLPNLRVVDILNKFNPIDQGQDIIAVITNDGPADVTMPFDVRGGLAITDAYATGMFHNGTIVSFQSALETVNRLDAGDTVQVRLFSKVTFPNGFEDFGMYSSAKARSFCIQSTAKPKSNSSAIARLVFRIVAKTLTRRKLRSKGSGLFGRA